MSTNLPDVLDFPVRLPIKLGQLIKLANLVADGSQARAVIQSGQVAVDGTTELKRGRVLHGGEIITFSAAGQTFRLRVSS